MSEEWLPHVVRQGECVSSLAALRGLTTKTVWNHAKNADLKKRRKNPDILYPGDILFLPPHDPKPLPIRKAAKNTYQVNIPKLTIRLCLRDHTGQPIKSAEVEVVGAECEKPATDADGRLEVKAPVNAKVFKVIVKEPKQVFQIRVGHLDPHDTRSGALSRIRQLGLMGDEEAVIESRGDASQMTPDFRKARQRIAIRAYQKAKGQTDTGELDSKTFEALEKDYGA